MRAFALPMLALAATVAAGEKPGHHPHFNDGGALPWYTELASATAAAKKEDKVVFIEYGREK